MFAVRFLRIGLALTAAVLLSSSANAGPGPQVTVQADRKSAQLGQSVVVTVRVRGATDTPDVRPPTVEGATIAPLGKPQVVSSLAADLEAKGILHTGTGQQIDGLLKGLGGMSAAGGLDPGLTKSLGGLDKNDYVFTYLVEPQRAGSLVVPAFAVTSGGTTTSTKPISVEVTQAQPQTWVKMVLSLSNPTPTVGEEVQLFVDLLIQRGQVTYNGKTYPHYPVKDMALTIPGLEGAAAFELVKPLEVLVQEGAIEPGRRGFRVNNLPGEVKMEHEPADGKASGLDPVRYRRRLAIPLRAREGGRVTIPAGRAAGDVYLAASSNRGQWEPFVAIGDPLTFTIVDLRGRADRPADFSGAIGPVRVTAKASQTRLAAGTPFTLSVRLEGSGSLNQATAPDLAARPAFRSSFRVRHEEERTAAGGAREFTYTLRPLSADVKEVPPIEMSYFNPRTDAFETAQSAPIPLEVTPATNVTPDPTPSAPPQPAPPPTAPASADTPAPAPIAEESAPVTGEASEFPWVWVEGGLVALCVLCATAWGVRHLRRRKAVRASRRQYQAAMAEAKRGLTGAEATVSSVRETLQDFLRRRFALPPGEVTPQDAADCLRRAGVEDGLARACADLLEACATAEFAPGLVSLSPSDLAVYTRRLIEHLGSAKSSAPQSMNSRHVSGTGAVTVTGS